MKFLSKLFRRTKCEVCELSNEEKQMFCMDYKAGCPFATFPEKTGFVETKKKASLLRPAP